MTGLQWSVDIPLSMLDTGIVSPIAEDSRLIVEVDRQTMREASLHVGALHQKGHPELSLSINLSPVMVQREDFGAGFSSLSYLHKFPISTLKIDRSFGQKLHSESEDASIVSVSTCPGPGCLCLAACLPVRLA